MELTKPNAVEGEFSQTELIGEPQDIIVKQEGIKVLPPFKKPWTPIRQSSCIVTKAMRKRHKLHSQLSPLVQRMLNSYSDNSTNNKECHGNSKSKGTWCISSIKKSKSKEGRSNRVSVAAYPYTRGKWIIQPDGTSSGVLDQTWLKLCRLSKQGGLPQCNSKLKEREGAIWVYCYASHAEKIFRVLKTRVHHQAKFYSDGKCLLHPAEVDSIELNCTEFKR